MSIKVSALIEELQKLPADNDLFLEVDGKILPLEAVKPGQFFQSNLLSARIEFDVIRAEQTLLSCLQFQRDQLTGVTLERIQRAITADRVDRIVKAFDEFNKQQEENKEAIEEIKENINRQDAFVSEEVPKEKKPKAKRSKKNELADAEAVLTRFYSGDKSDGIEAVKEAKAAVGEERSTEIFKSVRGK